MKITTRLALGFALLSGVMLGAVGYQLSVVQSMQEINQEVSLVHLDAARRSVRLLQGVEGVREFTAKYVHTGDAGYRDQWGEWETAAEEDLIPLRAIELTGAADDARALLLEAWAEYRDVAGTLRSVGGGLDASPENLDVLGQVETVLLRVRDHTEELIALNEQAVVQRMAEATAAGEDARGIAWMAAGAALALALLTWLFLYLSISGPLRRLAGGTRELALGRFDHRLSEEGGTELAELARDFNEMARKLGELEELKQDFVSHVSHELKGPLAAIQETILVLLEELPGPITDRQGRLLELSRGSAERLSVMIENLLEASRIEAGGREYDPVRHDLEPIVRSVTEESEPLAEDRSLRLVTSIRSSDSRLVCDGDRIREVVSNLVGNAIKFSPSGGRVRVTVGSCEHAPDGLPEVWRGSMPRGAGPFLLLSVEDEGPGVPEGHREAIFEKFHQVDRTRRIQGQGVGLGLAISRGIVEAHEGAIWVEPRSEGGSAFRVLIPVEPPRWRELDLETAHPASGEPSSPAAEPSTDPTHGRKGTAQVQITAGSPRSEVPE